jgi:hypothetical protein
MNKSIVIIGFLLSACSSEYSAMQDYNIVVDEILRYKLSDIGLVILETKPVTRRDFLDAIPIGTRYLSYYTNKGLLEKNDVEFLFNQIDSSFTITLDSALIEKHTISEDNFQKMAKSIGIDSTRKALFEEPNDFYVATFSTPLFTKDKSKIIFWVDIWHSPTWGQGYFFIVERKNNKWRIIEESVTYES